MALSEQDQKAVEHLAQEDKRREFHRRLQAQLKGDPEKARQVYEAFKPLRRR